MGSIVESIFTPFTEVITKLGDGIKLSVENLLWQDPTASEKVLSDFAQFGFVFLGIGLATGLLYFGLRLIRK